MYSFAVVLVCFNRLNGIKRLLNSLEKVNFDNRNDITLVFSVDFSDTNEEVREFAREYNWRHGNKKVVEFSENQGLKSHILKCGDLTNFYDILVVLEDDLYVSPSMYSYAYNSASFYMKDKRIAGISLYNFEKNWLNTLYNFYPQVSECDAYFLKLAQSWGQVWTREQWLEFKQWFSRNSTFINSDKLPISLNLWSSKSSWLKFFDRYCIECNKYFVYPYFSLSTNFSDKGTHSSTTTGDSQVMLVWKKTDFSFKEFGQEAIIYDEFMEREMLGNYLNINDEDLMVDIYANKPDSLKKKYILTTKKLNYSIVKSFSLSLKPAELSIIDGIYGDDIFLYDSSVAKKNTKVIDENILLRHSLGISTTRKVFILFLYSVKQLLMIFFERIKSI